MLDPPPLRRAGVLSDQSDPPPTSLGSLKRKLQTLITTGTSKQQQQQSSQAATISSPPPIPTDDVPPSPPPQIDVVDTPVSTSSTSPAVGDIRVPLLLQQGTPMTKVSLKRHKKFVFRLDADLGQIVWESKQLKISWFLPFFILFYWIANILLFYSSYWKYQRNPFRRRSSLLSTAIPTFTRLSRPMAHHCIPARWQLQNFASYTGYQGCF